MTKEAIPVEWIENEISRFTSDSTDHEAFYIAGILTAMIYVWRKENEIN